MVPIHSNFLNKQTTFSMYCDFQITVYTGVLVSPQPDQEGNKLHSPHFMELGGSLPHSQQSTTCSYPSQPIHSSGHHTFDSRSLFPSWSG